jgi:DNA-binding NarL/FixJ family response regulator
MKSNIIIYDNQGITRLGLELLINMYLKQQLFRISYARTKKELIVELASNPISVVIIDYALSDINSYDVLLNLNARFHDIHWVLFSDDFSPEFLKKTVLCNKMFSVVLKSDELHEIRRCVCDACDNKQFVGPSIKDTLSSGEQRHNLQERILTNTEKEILKQIAWGKTTKEIASERNISALTVITHRKNIYRKLEVNNSQEASRYALRAGIVDASDYYI